MADDVGGLRDRLRRLRLREEEIREQLGESKERQRALAEERVEQVEETPGRLGLVSPEERAERRRGVAGMEGPGRIAVEAGPATVGTAVGAGAGGLIGGPPGAIAGGVAGGFLGELLSQEAGITPEDDVDLGIAAGAPAAGPVAGKTLQGARRLIGHALEHTPVGRHIMGRIARHQAVREFQTIGGPVLASQQGLARRNANELFTSARNARIGIPGNELRETRAALLEVRDELTQYRGIPQVDAALRQFRMLNRQLNRAEEPVSFDTIIRLRTWLGDTLGSAERAGGIRLHTANKLWRSLFDDIERVAQSGHAARRPAKITQAAFNRARLETSIKEFEGGIARNLQPVEGQDAVELNVQGLRQWLTDIANPKHPDYNRHFATALKDEIPKWQKRLADLDKHARAGSPGGPGSIVVRGITAGGGAAVGAMVAGGPGAAVGALVGASMPEMLSGALMVGGGKMFERAVRMGRGSIASERWAIIAQAVSQASLSAQREFEVEQHGQ